MLTETQRCRVYEIRPMICRLWGLVKGMPCPYGCRPDGGLLLDSEGKRLLQEAERIGGTDEEGLARLVKDLLPLLKGEDVVRKRGDRG
jgi:hypothetical protein